VVKERGIAKLSRSLGTIGDTLVVTPAPESTGDWAVELEYTGASTRTPRGQVLGPGARYQFRYERFEPKQDWSVRFASWADSTDRASMGVVATRALATASAGTPLLTRRESRLDYFWYRPTIRELPQAKWALEATSSVDLAPGDYTVQVISDDAVRVWIDGRLAIDRWDPHESTVDQVALTGGRHDLRVQYYQADGWTELRLDIVRGTVRSKGSAGPH
jgi:hypothetical protein